MTNLLHQRGNANWTCVTYASQRSNVAHVQVDKLYPAARQFPAKTFLSKTYATTAVTQNSTKDKEETDVSVKRNKQEVNRKLETFRTQSLPNNVYLCKLPLRFKLYQNSHTPTYQNSSLFNIKEKKFRASLNLYKSTGSALLWYHECVTKSQSLRATIVHKSKTKPLSGTPPYSQDAIFVIQLR